MSSSNSANVRSRFDTLGRGDVREATAALRFSHTTHEEPVDYRELTPQESGIGGATSTLFQAPPAPIAPPVGSGSAPGNSAPRNNNPKGGNPGNNGSGNRNNRNRGGSSRRSSRSRRSRQRR